MPNCDYELNRQLQGLEARISSAEDNITAAYTGISALAANLAANPFTTASVAAFMGETFGSFNLTPIGYKLLKEVMTLIPGYDIVKQIQMMDAAALIDSMASQLGATMVGAVNQAVDQATIALEAAAMAELAHETAVLAGTLSAPQLAAMLAHAVELRNKYNMAKAVADNISGFLQAQIDISSCKASSLTIHS